MNIRTAVATALLGSSLWPALSSAEGDCTGRPPSVAERQFSQRAREAMRLLPAAPSGWQVVDSRESEGYFLAADALSCFGAEPMTDRFEQQYSRYSTQTWAGLVEQHFAARLQRPPSAAVLQLQKLGQERDALSARLGSAIGSGNFAAVEQVQEQLESLRERGAPVEQQIQRENAVYDHFRPDSFLSIQVGINGAGNDHCWGRPKKISARGASVAVLCEIGDPERAADIGPEQENATAVLGFGTGRVLHLNDEQEGAGASVRWQYDPRRPYTDIQFVTVLINGAPASLQAFIAATDWSGFAALAAR